MKEIHIYENKLGELEQVCMKRHPVSGSAEMAVMKVKEVLIFRGVNDQGVISFSYTADPINLRHAIDGDGLVFNIDGHRVELLLKIKKEAH